MEVKVKCIMAYNDSRVGRLINVGEELVVDKARADKLIKLHYVEQVEVIKEEKEDKKKPTKKVEKAIR